MNKIYEAFLCYINTLDNLDYGIYILYDVIDEFLLDDDFISVDNLCKSASTMIDLLKKDIVLGILTITLTAKDKLPSRQILLSKANFSKQLLYGLK